MSEAGPIVGIHGCGVTGQSAGRALAGAGVRLAWHDVAVGAAERAARRYGGVVLDDADDLGVVDTVVIASPTPHAGLVRSLIDHGRDLVSTGDHLSDVRELLGLHELARRQRTRVVVGAGLAPGLSGLIAGHLAVRLDVVDEIHVALSGTAGPACARQHHDALGDTAVGWHDGEWIERPGGSGRELCWFPDPVGPADCYRAALADPAVLHRAFPHVDRLSARVSATRRDRLTARLPMLRPPHAEGTRGAVRVEVRGGLAGGERVTHVAGVGGRPGELAGTVAALCARACIDRLVDPGVSVLGQHRHLDEWLLAAVVAAGVRVDEYTGVARAAV